VNAIKNGLEEKDNAPHGTVPSGIDEGHKEQVKSFLAQYFLHCSCYIGPNLCSRFLQYPHHQLREM